MPDQQTIKEALAAIHAKRLVREGLQPDAQYLGPSEQTMAYAAEEAMHSFQPEELDNIRESTFQEDLPDDDYAIATTTPSNGLTLVEGFTIQPGLHGEELERAERLAEMAHSYIGVIPRPIDSYIGRWLKCLGCVLMPIEADMGEEIVREGPNAGEVVHKYLRWKAPLFKLDMIDPDTQMNVVISGGGKYGRLLAEELTVLYGPGDFAKPRQIFFSQEGRGVGRDGKPRRMYRAMHRGDRPTEVKR